MATGEYEPITVSRLIGAPASKIFRVLADPRRHGELDGSEMLRSGVGHGDLRGGGRFRNEDVLL